MFPESIDRYQIQSEIARGGMSIIYLAYDPQHDRDVAIKVLPREYLYYPQFRARFQREIEIMISIRHHGIVPIYGYGQFQGQLYLVMRYMAGGSLEEYIEQRGTLSINDTASLIEQIAPILETAHSQGIVHRDLKPSNILFDEQGQPFISDFGIARLTEQSNIAALTGKALIGSPAYMSPEQGRIGIAVDGRSDIYSLGVMVFEMLTGQLPYDADTPMGLVLKHIMEPVPDILEVNPSLPPECRQLIQIAMAKDPAQRYPNAVELASALTHIANPEEYPSSAPAAQKPARYKIPVVEKPLKGSSAPAKKLRLPSLRRPRVSLPPFLYRFTRPFSRYLRMPARIRRPAIGYITLPPPLRRYLGYLGLPGTIKLPTNKLSRVISVILFIVTIIALCAGLVWACYAFIKMQAAHSAALIYLMPCMVASAHDVYSHEDPLRK